MSAMKRLTVSLIGFWQINKYDLEVTGAIALATTVEELRDQYAEGWLRSGAWDKLHTLLGIEEKDVEKDTGTIIQDMVAKELDLEAIEKAHFVMPEKEKDIATLNPYKVAKKRDARVKIVEVEEFVLLINSELTIEQSLLVMVDLTAVTKTANMAGTPRIFGREASTEGVSDILVQP